MGKIIQLFKEQPQEKKPGETFEEFLRRTEKLPEGEPLKLPDSLIALRSFQFMRGVR